MSLGLALTKEQESRFRERLTQSGFSIILEGIYLKDEEATKQHRFGFHVFDPVARFDGSNVFLYNPNNQPLNENHTRLIGLYKGVF